MKTILVTGGTGGIGKHTAIGLARQGARVVVSGRDLARGERAVEEIRTLSGNPAVALIVGDLSRQAEVRALAGEFRQRFERLDVLINNAGLLENTRRLTADGVEANFAVNVIAPFLLTRELLPVLRASQPARVLNLTGGMPGNHLMLDDLLAERSFSGLLTYTRSKAAMTAMSLAWADRLAGSGIGVHVVYPGSASTAMTQAMTPEALPFWMRLAWPFFSMIMRDDGGKAAARAARSSIFAATDPALTDKTGLYIDTNSRLRPMPSDVRSTGARERVWQLCEQLIRQTGER